MEATSAGEDRDAVEFVLRLARALHIYGTPSHQIEDALGRIAGRLGHPAQFMATPTSIIISVGPEFSERIHLVRVEPGEQDAGALHPVVCFHPPGPHMHRREVHVDLVEKD